MAAIVGVPRSFAAAFGWSLMRQLLSGKHPPVWERGSKAQITAAPERFHQLIVPVCQSRSWRRGPSTARVSAVAKSSPARTQVTSSELSPQEARSCPVIVTQRVNSFYLGTSN